MTTEQRLRRGADLLELPLDNIAELCGDQLIPPDLQLETDALHAAAAELQKRYLQRAEYLRATREIGLFLESRRAEHTFP